MSSFSHDSKLELRRKVRETLRGLTDDQRQAAALRARDRLEQQQAWKEAKNILFYAPLPGELDIWPLFPDALVAGKEIFLPRFDPDTKTYLACCVKQPEKDLGTGQFGIREPAAHCPQMALNRLDFLLVPGVAFDVCGRRLGRGRGYYDQILAVVRGKTCGVAFDEQIVAEVPVEPHDITVHCILTPSRWIEP
jgi:5-formyltetrahydrofolate cyclo-ligase